MAPASALVALRSPAATAAVIDVAAEYGVSADLALAGTGLAPGDLHAPNAAIGAAQEITVIRNVVGRLGDVPGLGARAGRRATLPSLGIWGFAMRSAQTLGDVVDIAITYGYGGFSWVLSRPWVDPRGQDVCIPYDLSGLPEDVRDFLIERDLAFTTSLLPEFFGTAFPIRIRSTLSAERGQALAHAFPEIDFSFGEAENAQVLTRRQLAKPLRWGDEEAMRICVRQCEALLAARSSHPGGTAAQLRAELRRDPRDRVTLAAFADRNHADVRTLRRRLATEGTSYREVNDQISESLAQELLVRGGLSPKDVADRLGFSDVTSFTRAFRRWTGETPAAYARRIRGSGL